MKGNRELIVYKSNELIQKFAMDLERTEWDLFDFMVAKIKSPKYDKDFNTIEFTVGDFYKEVYGKTRLSGDDYRTFKIAIGKLAKRQAWGVVKDGKYKNYETIMRLIDKPFLDPMTGHVMLKLDDNLKPYLLDFVDKNYSKFLLVTKASLSSKYTKKLYELLKSNENLAYGMWPPGRGYIKLEDFRELLGLPETYIAGMIKRRILETAKEEIAEKTDLSFVYREIKVGKRVDGYQFKIFKNGGKNGEPKKDDNKNSDLEMDLSVYSEAEVDFLEQIGVKKKEKADEIFALVDSYILDKYGEVDSQAFKNTYLRTKTAEIKNSKSKIKDCFAYMKKVIKTDTENINKVDSKSPVREEIKPSWMKEEIDSEEAEELKEEMKNWGKNEKQDEIEIAERSYRHYLKWNNLEKASEAAQRYKELTGKEIDEFEDVK